MTSIPVQRDSNRPVIEKQAQSVPMHFALSRLPSRTHANNNNGRMSTRFRLPAKLSTVSLVGRRDKAKSQHHSRLLSSLSSKPKSIENHDDTTVGLEECLESRPPLKLDLSGPKPTTYDPPVYLPWETTSPSYTMRPKTQPEKDSGGDRVAWNKQWIASHDIWTYRAHFDERYPWPSPAHYTSKPTVGTELLYLPQSPSHSMGKRRPMVFNKLGSELEPAPNQYDHGVSRLKLMKKFPSFTVQEGRKGGTMIWTAREPVPGPGSYNPRSYRTSSKRCAPNFSMSRTPREIGITRNCTL